jgi:hypothetical protein
MSSHWPARVIAGALALFAVSFITSQSSSDGRGNTAESAQNVRSGQSSQKRVPEFESEKASPAAREAWFMRGRISRDGLLPAQHLLKAWRQTRAIPIFGQARRGLLAPAATTGAAWMELGPRPELTGSPGYGAVSGRVTSIAVDLGADSSGNTAYVGAAFGGVWKSTNAASSSPTFTPISDGEPTLSIGAIAANNNTVIVGTGEPNSAFDSYYGLGLLVSTNGGSSWTQVTSADGGAHTMIGGGFSRIIIDPTNPSVILAAEAGTANYSEALYYRGVYRSTDGGATWSLALSVTNSSAPTGYSVTDLAYDSSTGVYYAAVRDNGVWVSSDHGKTWTGPTASPFAGGTPISAGGNLNFYRAALAARGGVLYMLISDGNGNFSTPTACTGTGTPSSCDTGLVQTTNGGSTWTPLAVPAPISLGGGYTENGLCIAGSSIGTHCQGYYDLYLAAPAASTALLLGGIDLWSAANTSGLTGSGWTNLSGGYTSGIVHPDQHAIALVDANHFYIGSDGGAWYTSTAGVSNGWTDLNGTIGTIQFISATPDPNSGNIQFGGSQDNGTSLGTGALAWNEIYAGDGGYTDATVNGGKDQYFTENFGVSLARSDNGGADGFANAVVNSSTIKDGVGFYLPYEILPTNNSKIALATCRVWEGPTMPSSTGSGWAVISPDLTTPPFGTANCSSGAWLTGIAVAPTSADDIYTVSITGVIAATVNGTASSPSWSNISYAPYIATGGPGVPLGAVAVSPSGSGTVYVGAQSFGVAHVIKTADGGNTWADISGNLPDAPVNSILIDPNNPATVYVATDVGVFVATDGGVAGEAWQQLGTGLPASAVFQLKISPTSPNLILAATHGRGVWAIPAVGGTPNFLMKPSQTSASVTAGSSATFTIDLSPTSGFSGTVSIACSGAPPNGTCSASPNSVTIGSSGAASTTITVGTAANSLIAPPPNRLPAAPWFWVALLAAAGLGLAGAKRSGVRLVRAGALALLLAAAIGAGVSCGGTNSSGSGNGTPSGTYAVTVTGTSGGISNSVQLTVTVK